MEAATTAVNAIMQNNDWFRSLTVHVLGHPNRPMDVASAPADAQVLNCHHFCLLLGMAGISYTYYGVKGSVLPLDGRLLELMPRTKTCWVPGSRRQATYTKLLSEALGREVGREPDRIHMIVSLYGAAHARVDTLGLPVVEAMVGYDHCWAPYRVFPSYAQQHVIYTRQPGITEETKWFDTVIPHFIDPNEFPLSPIRGDYALYLGRNAPDKGIVLAEEACRKAGIPLRSVHDGVSGKAKAELLGQARVVMMPTVYIEPFGYVAIEAQMCGVPVITTDWGAFAETVEHGVSGFRCRTQAEFVRALALTPELDREAIRRRAESLYGIRAAIPKYLAYFNFIWKVHYHGGYYADGAERWHFE